MRLRVFLYTPVFGACVLASGVRSQEATTELRIRLNGIDSVPVNGALIALLNTRDSVVAEGLSTEAGTRVLRAPPGMYRVRVRRIGYLPFVSEPVSLPRASGLLLNVESPRVVLERIVVNSKSPCGRNDPNATALSTVWDEIDKALRSSQLTTEDLSGIGRARTYRKEISSDGTVTSADTTVFSITTQRPFGAIDPVTLASEGYVVGDQEKGWHYFAPDETVLLSEQFAATHCFRLVRQPDRTGQIGVSFEPVPRRQLADITGVLWVDQKTSELREIVFRFVNAGALSQFDAGGFTHFRRVPSGTWIVDEWKLSVPQLAVRQVPQGPYSPTVRPQFIAIGRLDNGGGILGPGERTATGRGSSVVRGLVYDSVTDSPLAGAIVSLDGTVARSDAAGRFEFKGVPKGTHLLSFVHPVLSDIGYLALERPIDAQADTLDLQLGTPSLKTVWMRVCHDSAPGIAAEERGVLHGFVRDDSGQPVNRARVRISWRERTSLPGTVSTSQLLSLESTSDNTGHYVACGFRRLSRGTVAAFNGKLSSSPRAFGFESSLIVRRDLTVLSNAASASTDSLNRKR